jgi:DNA-binding NarL/FixJ family response regulator
LGEQSGGTATGDRAGPRGSAQRRSAPATVLIVDDFPVCRAGIRAIMGEDASVNVVGEAGSADAAVLLAGRLRPDLVVIDPVLNGDDATSAMRQIRALTPGTRMLAFAKNDDPEAVRAAVRAGADGFLPKAVSREALVDGVAGVLRGVAVIDPFLAMDALRGDEAENGQAIPEPLTPRELEVLQLLSQGQTNPQIARRLYMAVGTVKIHVEHILGKLGAADRTEAAVRASTLGLLGREDPASAHRPMPSSAAGK